MKSGHISFSVTEGSFFGQAFPVERMLTSETRESASSTRGQFGPMIKSQNFSRILEKDYRGVELLTLLIQA